MVETLAGRETSGAAATRAGARERLVEALTRLGPATQGRFFLDLPANREVDEASRLLDGEHLRARFLHVVPEQYHDRSDLRAAASRFTRVYSMAVVRPVVVALAMGIGLDASLSRSAIVWTRWNVRGSSANNPHGLHLRADAVIARGRDGLRDVVLRHLFADHLVPLYERVLSLVKISPKVLWSNVAESVGAVATAAAEQLPAVEARPFIEECDAILALDELPGVAGPNPLRGRVRWQDVQRADFPHGLMVRQICCVSFTLPDRLGQYCGCCPIPPVRRLIELIRP